VYISKAFFPSNDPTTSLLLLLTFGTFGLSFLGGIAFIGDPAPGYYLTLVCAVSLFALVAIRKTSAAS
jgi:hypothetical protein